jgi:Heterokaryon incompatibility protein (HET)
MDHPGTEQLPSSKGAEKATSIYTTLPSERHFRLLAVRGGKTTRPEYDVVVTSLDECPRYETVSYVWGDSCRTRLLRLVNDRLVFLTDSLALALLRVSSACTTGYLWIDQICRRIQLSDFNQIAHIA